MSVANRLRRLLDVHGHSYAKAEEVTGVSRETIRRLTNGEEPPKLAVYLRRIAAGYGVDHLALLEGATPRGEFEWNIRHAPPALRLEWLVLSQAGRVKLTLDFLRVRYPHTVSPKILATATGMSEIELRGLLQRWEANTPDRGVVNDLAVAVHNLTGISMAWFQWGGLIDSWHDGSRELGRVSKWTRSPSLPRAIMKLVSTNGT